MPMSRNHHSRRASKDPETTRDVPDFIQKLFRMLENKACKDTFCWGSDGTTFLVKDTNEFSRTILPKHFKHCNFASFVRQLNKYDFHKVRNADDANKHNGSNQAWEFVHPKFQRERRDLLEDIRRKTPGKAKKEKFEASASSATTGFAGANSVDGLQNLYPDNSPADTPMASTELAPEAIDHLTRLAGNLQKQIDQLRQSHVDMEAKFDKLSQIEEFVRRELSTVNQSIAAKDAWIQEFQKRIPPTAADEIPKSWSPSPSVDTTSVPAVSGAVPMNDPSSSAAAAAAAAASMNAGSIIGSPFRTADGLGFITLGRVAAKPLLRDNRPAIEIAPAVSGEHAQRDNTVTVKSPLTDWTTPPRVLLVDDDSVCRTLSKQLLSMIGCTIDLAKDGMEAITKMGAEKYDLILMDIVMPNVDGITATRNIRQYDMLTPIISMTSNFTDRDIMQYIGSGMTDILPKPFSRNTLYNILEKYCAHLKTIRSVTIEQPLLNPTIPSFTYTTASNENATSGGKSHATSSSSSAAVANATSGAAIHHNDHPGLTRLALSWPTTSPMFISPMNDNHIPTTPGWSSPETSNNNGGDGHPSQPAPSGAIVGGDYTKFTWSPTPTDMAPASSSARMTSSLATAQVNGTSNNYRWKQLKTEP